VSLRAAAHHAEQRLRLLEVEAGIQRAELAATLAGLEKRRALAWGGKVASWSWRVLSTPRVRWLIAANVLARLKRRWSR
jgi:hypothetical protein